MTIYDRQNYILTDTPLKKDLYKLFHKNDKLTILDIGGCEGEESIRYSRIFPYSSVYVFEPLPVNQTHIKQNILNYGTNNVSLIPMAASDEDGVSTFHVSFGHPENQPKDLDWDFGNKSSSLLPPEINPHKWLNFKERIDVKTIKLSSFLLNNDIEFVDFVHMDVQGAELKVLIGAEDYIYKIKAIWLEVADIEIYKNQPLRKDIENFMNDKGFYLVKSKMHHKVGDQFYLNKKYFKTISVLNKLFQFHKKL